TLINKVSESVYVVIEGEGRLLSSILHEGRESRSYMNSGRSISFAQLRVTRIPMLPFSVQQIPK
ncbi:unnamed protein product, partial [Sphenostylis stenocarpa]